ncbi:MAG TPA: superoxide dismutase, Ni [Spirochaetota bacterium]|nr:superoxide dismutase, Ni [Spirochaetota bacterium]
MYQIINFLDKMFHFTAAKAHCDIPCGIYDPITAQIAALTVVRMVDLIDEHHSHSTIQDKEFYNRLVRLITVKEEHSEKVKHEIRIIFGDFIKSEHFEKYPELPLLFHKIMQLGSADKQKSEKSTAVELLDRVNRFAEIFWEIKGIKTKKAKAPYAPNLEFVYPEH